MHFFKLISALLAVAISVSPAFSENSSKEPEVQSLSSATEIQSANDVQATKVAATSLPRSPVQKPQAEPNKAEPNEKTIHISLVLVGDTGYAPSRTRPHARGVSKYGTWQTWAQTTRNIRRHINGDINFANMESVVSAKTGLRPWSKAFNFVTHPNGVEHLVDVGFNLFAMANNHAYDYGANGIRESVKHMDRFASERNVVHAGIGIDRAQAAHAPVFESKGIKFAFGAIGIGASGGGLPRATAKRPGQLNIYNNDDNDLLMTNLAKAEADYRIVSVHRGRERVIRVDQGEIARIRSRMLDQGNIDLVIGHHAHVARGVELNNGRLIFYGLGNFLHQGMSNMGGKGGCQDYGVLARVHLVKQGEEKPELAAVEIVPLTNMHLRAKPLGAASAARRIAVLNGLASQFDNTKAGAKGVRFAVRSDGTGLYCTPIAQANEATAGICKGYRPVETGHAKVFRAALHSCGRSFGQQTFARLKLRDTPTKLEEKSSVKVAKLVVPAPKPVQKKITLEAAPKKTAINEKPKVQAKSKAKAKAKAKPKVRAKPEVKRKAVAKKAAKKTRKASKAKKQKSTRKVARLSNKALARMTAAQRKRYWTRYWYIKRGRKVPKHLR